MDFGYYLKEQLQLHPSIQPQDIIKLCYQAAFGAEHMLQDKARAKQYFDLEYEATPASSALPLYESISEDVCRINLASWKARELPKDELFELFAASTSVSTGTRHTFNNCIKSTEKVIQQGKTSFSFEEWTNYFEEYKKSGMPVVHHSEAYRQAERPAYRIVRKSLLHTDIT